MDSKIWTLMFFLYAINWVVPIIAFVLGAVIISSRKGVLLTGLPGLAAAAGWLIFTLIDIALAPKEYDLPGPVFGILIALQGIVSAILSIAFAWVGKFLRLKLLPRNIG